MTDITSTPAAVLCDFHVSTATGKSLSLIIPAAFGIRSDEAAVNRHRSSAAHPVSDDTEKESIVSFGKN
jgi:hypothetical protein